MSKFLLCSDSFVIQIRHTYDHQRSDRSFPKNVVDDLSLFLSLSYLKRFQSNYPIENNTFSASIYTRVVIYLINCASYIQTFVLQHLPERISITKLSARRLSIRRLWNWFSVAASHVCITPKASHQRCLSC